MIRIPLAEYWRLLRRYLVSQRGAALAMALLLLGSTGLGLLAPQALRTFIDAALAGASLALLVQMAALFLVFSLARTALSLWANYCAQRVAWTATNALRMDLVSHLVRLDLGFHKAHTPGELIERVDGDVSALADFFSSFVVDLLGSVLMLSGILVVIWIENAVLGILFVVFSLLSLGVLVWVHRFAPPHWRAERECSAHFYGFLGEMLSATEDIRSCGAVHYAVQRFLLRLREWLPVALRANLWGSIWMAGDAAWIIGQTLNKGVGGPMVRNGTLTLGTLYMIGHYLDMVVWGSIQTIQYKVQGLQHAQASIARVRELLGTASALGSGTAVLPPGAPSVSFDHVTFAYDENPVQADEPGSETSPNDPVLHDLSFHLEAGRVLGLLGRTGSGKTTIARLLFRFYDPQQGEIRLGDVELRQARVDALRARIGMVTQDVQLFDATLRDNLTFFDPQVSDDDLSAMLETLGLARWLERLPQGLDSPISGDALSAGEAQLVALARLFLKDPDLIVLDEASSRLDPATEALLGQVLDRLLHGRSAVIIAHRLATVARTDDILILDGGRAAEHGPRLHLAADPRSRFAQLLRSGLEEALT